MSRNLAPEDARLAAEEQSQLKMKHLLSSGSDSSSLSPPPSSEGDLDPREHFSGAEEESERGVKVEEDDNYEPGTVLWPVSPGLPQQNSTFEEITETARGRASSFRPGKHCTPSGHDRLGNTLPRSLGEDVEDTPHTGNTNSGKRSRDALDETEKVEDVGSIRESLEVLRQNLEEKHKKKLQEAEKLADQVLKVKEAIDKLREDNKQMREIKQRLDRNREHAAALLSAGQSILVRLHGGSESP